jgi:hypothetical protein
LLRPDQKHQSAELSIKLVETTDDDRNDLKGLHRMMGAHISCMIRTKHQSAPWLISKKLKAQRERKCKN